MNGTRRATRLPGGLRRLEGAHCIKKYNKKQFNERGVVRGTQRWVGKRKMRWKTWKKRKKDEQTKTCGVELSLFWAEARQQTVAREA